jgi:23S rRNA (guanosine2251-2'-O)-methyltransferase
MKPPHNNRQGRGPSDRPPFRDGGGRPGGNFGGQGGRDRPQGGGQGSGNRLSLGSGPDGGNREYRPRPQGGPPRDGQRHGHQRPHHDGPRHGPDAPKGAVWLYGHHAIAAALANPARRLRRLLLTEEAEAALGKQVPQPWAMTPERVDRGRLDHLLGRDIVHQGAALLADPLPQHSLQSVLEKPGPILVLDQVTDPRNVGAIMRSAAAFGAAAVITQDRNAPEETGALAKAASGALETLPLLRAVNIARTIIALKAANVWCIGLDAAGKALSGPEFADRRVALVLGAEGEGLRRLTRETCDEIAGLTIKGAMESLNVSAAASVALYELHRR